MDTWNANSRLSANQINQKYTQNDVLQKSCRLLAGYNLILFVEIAL